MNGYDQMTVAGILALADMAPALERDAYIAEFGTLKRYASHVKVWRTARLVSAIASDAYAARDWTVEDCTCGTVRDFDNIRPAHEICGGHRPAKGKRSESDLASIDTCTCEGHARDDHWNRVAALRLAVANASKLDTAWDALTSAEREAARKRTASSTGMARQHFAMTHYATKGPADLLQAIQPDGAPLADAAPLPAPVHVPHTCGPDTRQQGETWAQYGARRKGCGGCSAGADRATEVMLANRGTLRALSPNWHGLQADRVARQGRWSATEGSGLGAARIATATGTDGQKRGH